MTETARASATAHPIQGLVKYHGLRDIERRVPFHDSISLATAPIRTHTTVALLDKKGGPDEGTIDGQRLEGRPLERVSTVLDEVRRLSQDDRPVRIVSRNDFPAQVGLGSSASGFAALTQAAAAAYGLELDPQRLSAVARLGAGSAARSLTGWISEWRAPRESEGPEASDSHVLPGGDRLPLKVLAALVPCDEPTELVHKHVLESPFFQARLDSLGPVLRSMREAVATGDLAAVGQVAEQDTLNLHAVTMTAQPSRITWRPPTLAVMHEVRRLREEDDLSCWFSIDTGATVYVNTTNEDQAPVRMALEGIAGVERILELEPGPGARLVQEHRG